MMRDGDRIYGKIYTRAFETPSDFVGGRPQMDNVVANSVVAVARDLIFHNLHSVL